MFEKVRLRKLVKKTAETMEKARKTSKETRYIKFMGPTNIPYTFDLREYKDYETFIDNLFNAAQTGLESVRLASLKNKDCMDRIINRTPGELMIIIFDMIMTQIAPTLNEYRNTQIEKDSGIV